MALPYASQPGGAGSIDSAPGASPCWPYTVSSLEVGCTQRLPPVLQEQAVHLHPDVTAGECTVRGQGKPASETNTPGSWARCKPTAKLMADLVQVQTAFVSFKEWEWELREGPS